MKKKNLSIDDCLIDLYLNIKPKIQPNPQPTDVEHLKKLNPIVLVEYISTMFNILIEKHQSQLSTNENSTSHQSNSQFIDIIGGDTKNKHSSFKSKDKLSLDQESMEEQSAVNIYEKLLQEHESNIRNHIKVEHQLKLQNEAYLIKIDELERKIELQSQTHRKNSKHDIIDVSNLVKGDSTLPILNKEISNYKKLNESLNFKISELEKKIKAQKIKFEKDITDLEEKYKEKITLLNNKIAKLEVLTNYPGNRDGYPTKDSSKSKQIKNLNINKLNGELNMNYNTSSLSGFCSSIKSGSSVNMNMSGNSFNKKPVKNNINNSSNLIINNTETNIKPTTISPFCTFEEENTTHSEKKVSIFKFINYLI